MKELKVLKVLKGGKQLKELEGGKELKVNR